MYIVHIITHLLSYTRVVELLDQSAILLDNMTIVFQTSDTCFCYGYCGCSVSTCSHVYSIAQVHSTNTYAIGTVILSKV